jgi:hypothetical protein
MRAVVWGFAVIAIMAAAAIWLTRPLVSGMWDQVLNFGDAIHPVFMLDHNFRVITSWQWDEYWRAPMFTPYPRSAALADPHLGTAIWTWPVHWVTHSALYTHNVAVVGSFALTGIACYLLASHFTSRRWLALTLGLAGMAVPFRLAQVEHMHLAMTQWLVLSVWCLLRCTRQPHGLCVAGFGATFVLTLWSSVYYGLFQLLLLVPLALYLAVRHQWYRPTVLLRWWLWTGVIVSILCCVFLLPFYLAYGIESFDRHLEDVRHGSAAFRDFLNVTPRHWSAQLPGLQVGSVELTLFPGFTLGAAALLSLFLKAGPRDWWRPIGVGYQRVGQWVREQRDAAIGLATSVLLLYLWFFGAPFNVWLNLKYDFMPVPWTAVSCSFLVVLGVAVLLSRVPGAIRSGWIRRRSAVFWCWCGIAVFALLSMGPVIRYGTSDLAIGPYALLYRFMPGFHNMQVPGRLCVLLLPLGIILAAATVEKLIELFAWRRGSWVFASLAGVLLMLDLAVAPYQFQRVPLESELPATFQWLRDNGQAGGVLVLPTDTIERQRSPIYLYFAIYHRRPMLNGYASFIPSECRAALYQAGSFPEPAAIDILERRGVRYVVIDRLELERDLGAIAVAAKLEECDGSAAARRVAIPDSRFVLYELTSHAAATVE